MSTYGKAETQWIYGSTGRSYLRFYWERQSSSVSNNSSTIKWMVELHMDDTASYIAGNDITVTIDGVKTTVVGSRQNISGGSLGKGTYTTTIKHTSYGKGSFKVVLDGVLYGVSTHANVSKTFMLDDIPRGGVITSAPDFTDEENPTIYYSNGSGSAVRSLEACISYDGSKDNIPYRSIPINGSSYTFDLSATNVDGISYREQLLRDCTNSTKRNLYFYIRTKIGSDTLLNKAPAVFEIINATPQITLDAKDARSETIALTGDSSKIIQGQSIIQYTTTIKPLKHSSIYRDSVFYNGVWDDMPPTTQFSGTCYDAPAADLEIWAMDSRGYEKYCKSNLTLIKYFAPYCSIDAKLADIRDTYAYTDINFTGVFSNTNFGKSQNVAKLWYRYKENNGTYGNWIECNSSDFAITGNQVLTTVRLQTNYKNSVTIQGRITDLLVKDEALSNSVTINPVPVFDWGRDDFNFNVPVSITGEENISQTLNNLGVVSSIVEEYNSGSWHVVKYSNGQMDQYGWFEHTIQPSHWTAWSSHYYVDLDYFGNYPEPFKNIPYVFYSASGSFGSNISTLKRATSTYAGAIELTKPDKASEKCIVNASVLARGRWK